MAFLMVVGFTGISAGLAGNYLINKLVNEETKERVSADLNAARGIYEQELANTRTKIQITAERFFLRKNLAEGGLLSIKTELKQILKNEGLDILFLTDPDGKIIYRAHNPEEKGDDFSSHPLVHLPLNKKIVQTAFVIPWNEINKEGKEVTRKSAIPFTPMFEVERHLKQKENFALVFGAGVPVLNKEGNLLGVLAGGVILNRNYGLVDKIKNLVFKNVARKTKEVEVVTISLGNIRIATTYLDNQGNRAVGTRLTPEVSQKVLVEGKDFLERALVVDYWYITAYEPIKDVSGKPIGALGVGIFEEKYYYVRNEVIMFFLSLITMAMILAFTLSYILARSITRPVKILAREAGKIGRGEFVHITPPSRDEIGRFADTFNQMSQSLKEREKKLTSQTDELLRIKEDLEKTNLVLSDQSRELKRSVKELSVLFEASKKISSSLSLSEIMEAVLDLLMREFKTDIWAIRLLDDDGYLRIKSHRGLSAGFVKTAARKPTKDSYSGECFLTNKVIIVKDAEKVDKPISTNLAVKEGIKSFGLVPIAVGDEVLGVLTCSSKEKKGFFTEDYSEFMKTVGQQLAIAIRNVRQFERIKNFSQELEKEVKKRTEELQEKSARLAESEKLAALGEMADRVAHETRNPIVTIGGFARRLRRALPPDNPLSNYVDIIIKETERLELMIFWITELKKYISVDLEPSNINMIIERALERVKDRIEGTNITVDRDLMPDPPLVRVDRSNIEIVFSNLFENGIEAMGKDGVLYINTKQKNGNLLEVIISDTGKGISEDDIKSIYNPFFSSKGSGAGMGLTIAHKIIKDHQGSIKVKSKLGEGTTFAVELPLLKSASV
ncbi:MAG: cache domain-containing protein [Thermodesulfobacteriota bacterium]|nr:MAG: cache domain-containing protein [Thermodesulfobacteriota bacterium]